MTDRSILCRCGHALGTHINGDPRGDPCRWCTCQQFVQANCYTQIQPLVSTWGK